MKKRRLFVAINLPEKIRAKFESFQNEWRNFPARWVKPKNIHLTLNFLGYVEEGNIPKIADAIKEVAKKSAPFSLSLSDVAYGPSGKKPRMIWVKIKDGENLENIQRRLSRAMRNLPFHVHQETKLFNPHLTICRFNSFHLREWEGAGLPEITAKFEENINVKSVELMESKLGRLSSKYSRVASFPLLS